jgi:regulator of sirC expression with transglutaminase-like and TPR domain
MATHVAVIRRRFADLVQRPDAEIPLAQAALLLAQEEYPSMDPDDYLRRLDEFALAASRSLLPGRTLDETVSAINAVLFEIGGLRGNAREYYDPRNSFLNEVLDRKLGIPISLSVIYLEVATRLGLRAHGIGLPGHFIVQVAAGPAGRDATGSPSSAGDTDPAESWLIDPFDKGRRLTEADCARRVRGLYGDRLAFHPSMLAPLRRRQILTRMLNNLKAIYVQRDDYGRALAAVDRLLLLEPDAVGELRDRGAICQQIRFVGQAVADYVRYLERAPHAADADVVRHALRILQEDRTRAN